MTAPETTAASPINDHPPSTSDWIAECKRRLCDPFPAELIEEKNGLSYLPHEVIRQRLIEATGNCFDWTIDQILFRDDGVTRRAKDRTTGETPRPLSMVVVGRLTIPELGTRPGIGAHPLDAGAGEDAAYKSAESDAVKRAAMAFGVALEQLYVQTGEAKRVQTRRISARSAAHPARSSGGKPAAWQARIDAALGLSLAEGKRVWQQLVAEAINEKSEEQLAMLIASARTPEAAEAITERAKRQGIGDVTLLSRSPAPQ